MPLKVFCCHVVAIDDLFFHQPFDQDCTIIAPQGLLLLHEAEMLARKIFTFRVSCFLNFGLYTGKATMIGWATVVENADS